MKTYIKKFFETPWGGGFVVMASMMLPLTLDSACIWNLRATHILGGGGYAICLTAFKNAVFIAGLYLILGRVVRWLCIPLLWVVSLIASMEIFVKWYFGFNFEGDWILTVMESSPSETTMFIRQYLGGPVVIFSIVIFTLSSLASYALCCLKDARRGVSSCVVGCCLLVPVAIREVTADSWGRNFGTVQTKRVVVDTVEKLKMYRDLSAISKEPAINGGLSLSKEAEDVLGVIVVGESATRNSMSLYGYARETTPRFDGLANELYVFKDVVAPWGNTPMACRFVLTEATLRMPDAAYCTLPQVFLQAGVGSCLISSQGRWGAYGHVGGYIFNSCKEKIYLPEVSKLPIYDSDVLPYLRRQFAVSNQCVFVHLAGSHFPPESTYPKHVVAFKADSKIDHYDNSIRFTDEVLGAIIDMLKTSSRPSYMIYFSDHGETPRAKTWRDSSTRDLWEIPLVVWLSPEYKRRFPGVGDKMRSALDKPIQTDRIFKLFLSLAQIKGFVGHCCEDDVLAEDFSGHHERIMSIQNR